MMPIRALSRRATEMHVTPVRATQGDGIEKVFGIAFCVYAAS
jgi:hypothetical protein